MGLRSWQFALATHLLLPTGTTADILPLTLKQPLALYQELLSGTVLETMQGIYPHTYRLLSQNGEKESAWKALIEQYRRQNPNASYKLSGAAQSFPAFLATQQNQIEIFPFLSDLARYEWLELEMLQCPDELPSFDLLAASSRTSPVVALPVDETGLAQMATTHALQWTPVRTLNMFAYNIPDLIDYLLHNQYLAPHKKTAQTKLAKTKALQLPLKQQAQKQSVQKQVCSFRQATEILIYRDDRHTINCHEGHKANTKVTNPEVRFFRLSAFTAAFIRKTAQAEPLCSLASALQQLKVDCPDLSHYPEAVLYANSFNLLVRCHQQGMLLGLQKISDQ
jgi:hypothetical protein